MVFEFQSVLLFALKMWEEQYIAILLILSKRHEIVLLVRFGRVECNSFFFEVAK